MANAKQLLKEIQIQFCKECESHHGKKDIDVCFACHWHKIFNELYEKLIGKP